MGKKQPWEVKSWPGTPRGRKPSSAPPKKEKRRRKKMGIPTLPNWGEMFEREMERRYADVDRREAVQADAVVDAMKRVLKEQSEQIDEAARREMMEAAIRNARLAGVINYPTDPPPCRIGCGSTDLTINGAGNWFLGSRLIAPGVFEQRWFCSAECAAAGRPLNVTWQNIANALANVPVLRSLEYKQALEQSAATIQRIINEGVINGGVIQPDTGIPWVAQNRRSRRSRCAVAGSFPRPSHPSPWRSSTGGGSPRSCPVRRGRRSKRRT